MNMVHTVALIFLCLAQPAYAETCREQFIRIFTADDGTPKAVKTYNTATTNGGSEQKFNIFSIGNGHVLSQALVPPAPWSLIYDQKMFISNDKGNTWIKVRDLPKSETNEALKAAALKNIGNETCGTDTHEGKAAITIQADLDITPDAPFQTNIKFWMDEENGDMLKSITETKLPGQHHITVQIVEQAPDLILPTPE